MRKSARIAYAHVQIRERRMVADSNSKIAWHRAQIKKHNEALKHFETAKFLYGEIAGAHATDKTEKAVAGLKRKIRSSEQVIAEHERQTRRPLTTDFKSLTNVAWSNWNAHGPSNHN
jgi:hypothetical protein